MAALHTAACRGAAKLVEERAAAQGVRFSSGDLDALARHFEDPANELKLQPVVDDNRTHVTIDVSDIDVAGLGARLAASIPELLKSGRTEAIAGIALVLFVVSVWAAWSDQGFWAGAKEWAGNTVPEFLGAVLISWLLAAYFRDDARANYIGAMRAVREAVSQQNLEKDRIQQLMTSIVPAISSMHFGTKEPDTGEVKGISRANCGTCRAKAEPLVNGRCVRCGEIEAAWSEHHKHSA